MRISYWHKCYDADRRGESASDGIQRHQPWDETTSTMRSELERRRIATPLGPMTFRVPATEPNNPKPVVVVVMSVLTSTDELTDHARSIDDFAEVVILDLPVRESEGFETPSVERLAQALGLALHQAFPRRRVTLLGMGDAALVALQARAPEIRHVIVVEPPLLTAKPWKGLEQLRTLARTDTSPAVRNFLSEVYGVGAAAPAPRDHRPSLDRVRVPVTVAVSDEDPSGLADPSGPPSQIDLDDRAWLACIPDVSLEVLSNARFGTVWDMVRRVLADDPGRFRDAVSIAEQLARSAPQGEGFIHYTGPAGGAFEAAFLRHSPSAVFATGALDRRMIDLLVFQDPELSDADIADRVGLLKPGGNIVAACPLGPVADQLESLFVDCGMSLLRDDPIISPANSSMVRAYKGVPMRASRVDIVPLARRLMDIRTVLPATALRSDPRLLINYYPPPYHPVVCPIHDPRIVVVQRPASRSAELWQNSVARSISVGHVVVIEYDDHPELVSLMVKGKGMETAEWERFRVAHAIQTSTEKLAEVFREYNPEVRVFSNAVFDLLPFPAGPRPPRVFYGGVTRGPFAVQVAQALRPAIDAHPGAEFSVIGDRQFFEALPTSRKTFSEYTGYERYLEIIASCSVSLSPLRYQPMIDTKSDAKYLDAARAGVVTIASPTVYAESIRSGENGLIARKMDHWPAMLTSVLGDQAYRERLARAAWEDIRDNRMFSHQIAERSSWYSGLLERQESLDHAVFERSPEVAARLQYLKTTQTGATKPDV